MNISEEKIDKFIIFTKELAFSTINGYHVFKKYENRTEDYLFRTDLYLDWIQKAAQEVKEFDITANYNGYSAQQVVTEYGVCYTFNSRVAFVGSSRYVVRK